MIAQFVLAFHAQCVEHFSGLRNVGQASLLQLLHPSWLVAPVALDVAPARHLLRHGSIARRRGHLRHGPLLVIDKPL